LKVRETESRFIRNLRAFVDEHLAGTAFHKHELDDSYAESLRRVHFLKDVIEEGTRVCALPVCSHWLQVRLRSSLVGRLSRRRAAVARVLSATASVRVS
jgi:hypothetical protein